MMDFPPGRVNDEIWPGAHRLRPFGWLAGKNRRVPPCRRTPTVRASCISPQRPRTWGARRACTRFTRFLPEGTLHFEETAHLLTQALVGSHARLFDFADSACDGFE